MVGGTEIVPELNRQVAFACLRVGSKDAHSPKAVWVADGAHPPLSSLEGEPNADLHWPRHAEPGTVGFDLIAGLPEVTGYDYFVWKGVELDMHPYGACFHDLAGRLSTGVIEFLQARHVDTVLVGGLATDYCVKTTALQLREAGFRVVLNLADAQVAYRFQCRSAGADLRPHADAIRREIDALSELAFQEDELDYLGSLRFMKPDFIDFLRLFRLQRRYVDVRTDSGELEIEIRGPWLHTIPFEVPVLAIVNELAFAERDTAAVRAEGLERLEVKVERIRAHPEAEGFRFVDFGTRRRFSRSWQGEVVGHLAEALPVHFTGTSNVLLAREFDLTPVGTMAHEFLQAAQALGPRLVDSQKFALEAWAQEYRGDLGIALSDVVGIDAFLRDFDLYFSKLFDGVRHDSGDAFEWTEKVLAHYRAHRIDPRNKHLVFSDGLDVESALGLYERYKHDAMLSFGIGTNLTNDLGPRALNIVIKMVECNDQPVAKLSDSPGKTMCRDETYLAYLQKVFRAPAIEA